MSKQKISKRKGIRGSGPARIRTGVWGPIRSLPDGPRPNSYVLIRNTKKDKTIEEFKEGTSNLKKHLEELEIKLESGWF